MDLGTVLRLDVESFDLALCLDKEDRAVGLVERVRAQRKLGFGLDPTGSIRPLNPEAEYAFSLGLSDELKFRKNERTYQDFTFESAGLKYDGEEYVFSVTKAEREQAAARLSEAGWKKGIPAVGLNTGAGPVFATKKWRLEGFVELAELILDRLKAQVVLLGGPEEVERNREIARRLGSRVVDSGCDNPLRIFAAMLSYLDIVVAGDTLAMHLAIAQKVPVAAIFGPSPHQEVELYGRGEIVVAEVECSPCLKATCEDMRCMKNVSAMQVFQSVERLLAGAAGSKRRKD